MQVVASDPVEAMGRLRAARFALGGLGACTLVAVVDPSGTAPYPVCPTAALLGWDCPACGTLRGLHALSRGRFADALDHNLLLLVAVPLAAVVWWGWVRHAAGRPARGFRWPAWASIMVVAVTVTFGILRNVPFAAIGWLGSSA